MLCVVRNGAHTYIHTYIRCIPTYTPHFHNAIHMCTTHSYPLLSSYRISSFLRNVKQTEQFSSFIILKRGLRVYRPTFFSLTASSSQINFKPSSKSLSNFSTTTSSNDAKLILTQLRNDYRWRVHVCSSGSEIEGQPMSCEFVCVCVCVRWCVWV